MKRILIFGNSGSGKSTLAKALCARYGLAHLDLDSLAWEKAKPPARKSICESEKAIQVFLVSNKEWVIEGCYSDLLALVTQAANKAIFLNPGVDQCISNCRSRPWEPHKYPSQEAQDENLKLLIEWVKQYAEREDEFSLKSHRALYECFEGEKVEHQSTGVLRTIS
ncbi:MAG: shikimate kinase [Gammaproteobacteria bacterium]|nr:shikimate kinase [Gammaproteobacteria bacterium]